MNTTSIGLLVCGMILLNPESVKSAPSKANSKLSIYRDVETGQIILSTTGKGVLKQASDLGSHFKPLPKSHGSYVIEPTASQMLFQAESVNDGVFSVNVVGYVNLRLPPGLSLIANPLYYTNNTLAFWWPNAPDGAQVFKYTEGSGYEVSTFDGIARAWSNPDLDVSIGTGFFFRNPSSDVLTQTFIGEVLQGTLVNPLPVGLSTKGSLVPQAGSINDLHHIPGQPGDELRTFTNDLQGGGIYNIITFSQDQNAWVPDLNLGVGEGFWIQKQNAQDWVRVFFVN